MGKSRTRRGLFSPVKTLGAPHLGASNHRVRGPGPGRGGNKPLREPAAAPWWPGGGGGEARRGASFLAVTGVNPP